MKRIKPVKRKPLIVDSDDLILLLELAAFARWARGHARQIERLRRKLWKI